MAEKPVFYWDACMFYEVLGDEAVRSTQRSAVDRILRENASDKNLIVTSVVTHLEVLPSKLGSKGAEDNADYLSLFDGERFVEVEISANILLRAREIRDHYFIEADEFGLNGKMMDLADAIHLATASINGVSEFHTRDKAKKGSKVPLVGLYELRGENSLCGKYALQIVSPEDDQGDMLSARS